MTKPDREAILRRDLEAISARLRRDTDELARRGGPPQPGDLYVFRDPGQTPVRWAVIEVRRGEGRLWHVVAGDEHVLAGSADVSVPETARFGPLVMRCALDLWVDESHFADDLRVGVLEPAYVEQARVKLAQLAAGPVQGTEAEQAVQDDPDYQDWMNELTAARVTLRTWLAQPRTSPQER